MTRLRFTKLFLLPLLALWPGIAPAIVTFNVNDIADHPDDIHDGVCADAFGKCTLRAAIMEANMGAGGGGYVFIDLPPGTYILTRGVTNPDDHSNGDLDIASLVQINGSGAAATIIDANHLDRAFKITLGDLELFDVTVMNGQPSSFGGRSTQGGAILVQTSLGLVRCVLDSNAASEGGAVELIGSTPSVLAFKSTFSRNVAANGGGGVFGFGATATFQACTFATNTSGYGGGIAMVSSGQLHVENTTLYGNDAASSGGGIFLFGVTAELRNATLGGNGVDSDLDSDGTGGGLYAYNSTVTLSNSLFANVNDKTHGNDDCSTSSSTVTFSGGMVLRSIAGCGYSGFAYEGDPLLGPLKDNGGPTATQMLPTPSAAVDYVLAQGCPGFSGVLTVDQRGVKRPIGSACDLGATELEPVGDANGDGLVNVSDVFYLINFLFAGGAAPLGRANVNGDGSVTVTDVFYLINFLFAAGSAPL